VTDTTTTEGTPDMTTPLIHPALAAVQSAITAVSKDDVNEHQRYKFRGIDALINGVHAALATNGVVLLPRYEVLGVEERPARNGVQTVVRVAGTFTFCAVDGSTVVAGPFIGEGHDSSDKASNKAMTACLKYCLIQTFTIPTQHDDSDRTTEPREPLPTTEQLMDRIQRLSDGLNIPVDDLTAKWRSRNGDLDAEALPRLSPEALWPLVQSLEAYVGKHPEVTK
jgi:hypothetical protein